MQAAIIDENGVVTNIIVTDSLDVIPDLIDGEGAAIGDLWDGETFVKPDAAPVDIAALKVAKNAEIDQWRLEANRTHFPVGDKFVAIDVLSRSDIDGTAGYVSLFGAFPPNWPGGWKATDSSIIPMPTVDDFKAMYAAMIARGTENFNRSEALKETLATAATPEAVATIEW